MLSKLLHSGESLYLFSDDLVWGCWYYAEQANNANNEYVVFLANTSCVFLGASFLEAKLNELTAEMVVDNPAEPNVPISFWKVVHEARKDLSSKEKWNLIASVSQ